MIKKIKTKGMHCRSCEKIIEKTASSVEGVKSAKSNFANEELIIEFDENKTNLNEIIKAINNKGYECHCTTVEQEEQPNDTKAIELEKTTNDAKVVQQELKDNNKEDYYSFSLPNPKYIFIAGAILFLLGLFWIIKYSFSFNFPTISPGMGLAIIFTIGLLTSFHCVGMCGGFVLSYTTKEAMNREQSRKSKFLSHLKYGSGKTITYCFLGALFGLLGSFVTFTPKLKGIAALIAGLFLIIYGFNMINVFPWLRNLQFRGPKFLDKVNVNAVKSRKGPFVIGLLNGLMIACGPLQAMLIYSAGTGSAFQGALSMLVFGLGTLPLMLGFGSIATVIGSKFTHKILKVSAIIVILLGVVMVNRGLTLTGTGYDFNSLITSVSAQGNNIQSTTTGAITNLNKGYQEIRMDVTRYGWQPSKFVLKKDIPVKWIINGKEINGCNNAIQVPKLGLNFNIKQGEQIIEFTPTEEGIIPWSCWMGMIHGVFVIKDDINIEDQEAVKEELSNVNVPSGGSCGSSCGGSGCGCGCGGKR